MSLPEWGFKGSITGAWHVPVTLSALGNTPLRPPMVLGPGQTIDFWLVMTYEGDHYEWHVRTEDERITRMRAQSVAATAVGFGQLGDELDKQADALEDIVCHGHEPAGHCGKCDR